MENYKIRKILKVSKDASEMEIITMMTSIEHAGIRALLAEELKERIAKMQNALDLLEEESE